MSAPKLLLVANTDWYLYNFRLALARFLREQGFDVVLISPPGPFVPELEAAGFRWIAWPVGRRTMLPWVEMRAIARLVTIYRAEKPALVHHFTIKPVLYGSLAARLAGVPAVINSVTGLGYVFLKEGLHGRLLRAAILPLYRVTFAHPRLRVIFENSSDQDRFIALRLVRPDGSCVIEGVGVDTLHFKPQPEPRHGPPLVVFPGRMLLDKGLGTLVEAARRLRAAGGERSDQSIRIALVGLPDPGNPATVAEADLRAWQQQGLVEWWGFREDMAAVYGSCHIVTLPSAGEGLPTALIEAAACGRPIVTTDVPGCREVVEDGVNGLLVSPGDARSLADALETLACDPSLRSQMGAAGRRIALEKFTGQKVHAATLAVYRDVLSSERSQAPGQG